MSYTHLAREERYQIRALLDAGQTIKQIGENLGRSPSTISREVRRNQGNRGHYFPRHAHLKASARRQANTNARQIDGSLWAAVEERLREDWSPEQISARLNRKRLGRVSHERIYQRVYADKAAGGTLHRHLRCQKAKRKRYRSGRERRGKIANRRPISERPAIVDQRRRFGDWEADTVIGKRGTQSLVTLVERRSQYVAIQYVERRLSEPVTGAIINQLGKISQLVHSITFDNGKEFAGHEHIAKGLAADCYFADPYASWQRGLNEQVNGLIRQYAPKSSDLAKLSEAQIVAIVKRLNNRPRKTLGWQTPYEVLSKAAKRKGVALRD